MSNSNQNTYASSLSVDDDLDVAVRQAAEAALAELGGQPDLTFAFISQDYGEALDRFGLLLQSHLPNTHLIGCTAESVVGRAQEVEQQRAVSLWLARLPAARLDLVPLQFQRTAEGGAIVGWSDELLEEWPEPATLIVLADPFSFPADYLLALLNEGRPRTQVLGGMASGAAAPGESRLYAGRQTFSDGAVGLLVSGAVDVRCVVSQGCRPIGKPLVITRAEANVIQELGGRSPLEQLKQIFATLPTTDQRLAQQGLHVGRVVNEYQDRFEAGDFLVRNVIGLDQRTGGIGVGDYFRAGQTVQFHVRDERSAHADLHDLLYRQKRQEEATPGGALLFTCNGRGTRLFSEPHHDASAIAEVFGQLPTAGLFAQGELGPVGTQSFVHGFTASIALFY